MTKLIESPFLAGISIIFGAAIALLAPMTWDAVQDEYDRSHPVWVAESTKVTHRDADTVRIHIVGRKTRDCSLLRTWAQSMYQDRPATDASVVRTGGLAVGYRNRAVGTHDLGEFVLLGVPSTATSVVIHVEHDCGGRVLISQLGQAALPAVNR